MSPSGTNPGSAWAAVTLCLLPKACTVRIPSILLVNPYVAQELSERWTFPGKELCKSKELKDTAQKEWDGCGPRFLPSMAELWCYLSKLQFPHQGTFTIITLALPTSKCYLKSDK